MVCRRRCLFELLDPTLEDLVPMSIVQCDRNVNTRHRIETQEYNFGEGSSEGHGGYGKESEFVSKAPRNPFRTKPVVPYNGMVSFVVKVCILLVNRVRALAMR